MAVLLIACKSGKESEQVIIDSTIATKPISSDTTPARDHKKEMQDAMSSMAQQIKTLTPTGDPDFDFANIMKHHHEAGITIARSEIAGGNDTFVKSIAQKIINGLQPEVKAFDDFIKTSAAPGRSDLGIRAQSMLTTLTPALVDTLSTDKAFATMVIPHHTAAIKIAEDYMKVGRKPEIKKIAVNIIQTQQNEIRDLQDWLNKH